jgi:hypothetical protein
MLSKDNHVRLNKFCLSADLFLTTSQLQTACIKRHINASMLLIITIMLSVEE